MNLYSTNHSTAGKALTAPAAPITQASIDDSPVHARAALNATWRPCVTHGKVSEPFMRARQFKGSQKQHVEALCPDCLSHLGFIKQRRVQPTCMLDAALAGTFNSYRMDALAKGQNEGTAWARFRREFGRDPDPGWVLAGMEGTA